MNVIYRTKADFRIAVDDPARKMTGKMVSWYPISIQLALDHRHGPSLPDRTGTSWLLHSLETPGFDGVADRVLTTTSAPRRPKIPNLKALPL